jgi:hypothetical protein
MSSDHRSGIFTFGTLDEEMPRYSSHQEGLPRYSSPAKKPSGFPTVWASEYRNEKGQYRDVFIHLIKLTKKCKSCREFVSAIKKKLKRVDLE